MLYDPEVGLQRKKDFRATRVIDISRVHVSFRNADVPEKSGTNIFSPVRWEPTGEVSVIERLCSRLVGETGVINASPCQRQDLRSPPKRTMPSLLALPTELLESIFSLFEVPDPADAQNTC
jgi:hypothetical protein